MKNKYPLLERINSFCDMHASEGRAGTVSLLRECRRQISELERMKSVINEFHSNVLNSCGQIGEDFIRELEQWPDRVVHWRSANGALSACGIENPNQFVSNDAMTGVTCEDCLEVYKRTDPMPGVLR